MPLLVTFRGRPVTFRRRVGDRLRLVFFSPIRGRPPSAALRSGAAFFSYWFRNLGRPWMAEPAEAFRRRPRHRRKKPSCWWPRPAAKECPCGDRWKKRVRPSPRRGTGEKANKKQMAYVGAVYSSQRARSNVALSVL
jgi:hypothetical protein